MSDAGNYCADCRFPHRAGHSATPQGGQVRAGVGGGGGVCGAVRGCGGMGGLATAGRGAPWRGGGYHGVGGGGVWEPGTREHIFMVFGFRV